MKPKYLFLVFWVFFAISAFPQNYDEIERNAEAIILHLACADAPQRSGIDELSNLLIRAAGNQILQGEHNVTAASLDSLKTHLIEFEAEAAGIGADSALTLFNAWYLHLQRVFYSYNKQEFFNSPKTKILFFSTSVSCRCTMEMCKKQLTDILTLKNQNKDNYSVLIVDSYWNNDLQLKYESYFAPSVLVFNGRNELLALIEYDDNMINKLTDWLLKLNRGEKI